ncbi:hypothetical protein PENTCL1PPCAC_8203, partial [Pristionchus entomophagus]
LNVWLFYALVCSKQSIMDSVYRVPIYVSSVLNLLLCLLISIMNFVHTFRDGTFVTGLFSPLAQVLLRAMSLVAFQIGAVLTTLMWTLIPVTATLQII